MESFLRENQLPGGALAVARQGRLVYARGFGYAEVGTRSLVRPDALFRIASISKPITAVAILQLVDAGLVDLQDRVTELLASGGEGDAVTRGDPRWGDLTVEHLLQHRGGWDSARSGDPMFRSIEIAAALGIPSPPGSHDIVRFMQTQPLDFEPGTRCVYSNFGYCVLGRLIERVTGCDYETHVRSQLLAPLGIQRMRIGRTRLADRAQDEVCYYVPWPYGAYCVEAMDAHGGWLASAVDLVRFGSRLPEPAPQGVLSAAAWSAMVARPPGSAGQEDDGSPRPSYYGLGWQVRPVPGQGRPNLWHTGRFAGASSILVVRH
ncbi:MAG: beta-lactamase family protein, partial [Pirellulaceae bacterium]|nr:beta-lactamase family protein [Pirellulaceae bacterium]